jgi:hypothetical protein
MITQVPGCERSIGHLDRLVVDAVLGLENLVVIERSVMCLHNHCIFATFWKLSARLQVLDLCLT